MPQHQLLILSSLLTLLSALSPSLRVYRRTFSVQWQRQASANTGERERMFSGCLIPICLWNGLFETGIQFEFGSCWFEHGHFLRVAAPGTPRIYSNHHWFRSSHRVPGEQRIRKCQVKRERGGGKRDREIGKSGIPEFRSRSCDWWEIIFHFIWKIS
jgi:hypothetical protein